MSDSSPTGWLPCSRRFCSPNLPLARTFSLAASPCSPWLCWARACPRPEADRWRTSSRLSIISALPGQAYWPRGCGPRLGAAEDGGGPACLESPREPVVRRAMSNFVLRRRWCEARPDDMLRTLAPCHDPLPDTTAPLILCSPGVVSSGNPDSSQQTFGHAMTHWSLSSTALLLGKTQWVYIPRSN